MKLTVVTIYREYLRLALAATHPLAQKPMITPTEMSEEPYLDRLHCEFRSTLIKHFMDRNIVMRPRVHSEREDWVQQLVASGAGVCALPERSVIVDGIALRPVEGFLRSGQHVHHHRRHMAHHIRERLEPSARFSHVRGLP